MPNEKANAYGPTGELKPELSDNPQQAELFAYVDIPELGGLQYYSLKDFNYPNGVPAGSYGSKRQIKQSLLQKTHLFPLLDFKVAGSGLSKSVVNENFTVSAVIDDATILPIDLNTATFRPSYSLTYSDSLSRILIPLELPKNRLCRDSIFFARSAFDLGFHTIDFTIVNKNSGYKEVRHYFYEVIPG